MAYTVTEIHGEPTPFQTKAGHNLVGYWLSLEGVGERVNWNRPSDADAPAVGQGYDLDLEEKQNANGKYFKATLAKRDGRPTSTSTHGSAPVSSNRSIEAQVAMKEAGNLMVGFMATGWRPDSADQLAEVTERLFDRINAKLKDGAK